MLLIIFLRLFYVIIWGASYLCTVSGSEDAFLYGLDFWRETRLGQEIGVTNGQTYEVRHELNRTVEARSRLKDKPG